MIDLSEIPAWCLFPAIEKLEPNTIKTLASVNDDFADICTSQTLWKDKYQKTYEEPVFKLSKKQKDIDWVPFFGKRFSIAKNFANHKPKAKSFKGKDIIKIRSFSNSFAFLCKECISIVAFDYFDNSCEYENVKTYPITAKDFIFLDNNTILAADDDKILLIKIDTGETKEIDQDVGHFPMIHALSSRMFAIVTNRICVVYNTNDLTFPRCTFRSIGKPIALSSHENRLYIATTESLSAHDVYNPRGATLWTVPRVNHSQAEHCFFNIKAGCALYDDVVVKLLSGRIVTPTIASDISCGAIVNKNLVIVGSGESVIYYDIKKKEEVFSTKFGEDDNIKSIFSSPYNNIVAIAGEKSVHIVDPHYEGELFVVKNVRPPLKCGSIGLRKLDHIGELKQVLFDGERVITNMGDFVRVYDFFTGNKKKVNEK